MQDMSGIKTVSLYLSDLFKRAGIEPKKVMLIRHSLNDTGFKTCYDAGMTYEYTKYQKNGFAKNAEYWMVFISDKGTTAKFYAMYRVNGKPQAYNKNLTAPGFPLQDSYSNEEHSVYSIVETNMMNDLVDRLIIEWGKATTAWFQWGTNEKAVLCIQASQKKAFEGFETLILSYDELKEIVNDTILYQNWHSAMKSVYAIYVIADTKDGELYVGSASSDNGGLLARWTDYVTTYHGGNKRIIKKLKKYPERYHDFQFSILQILPMTMTKSDVDKVESLWKNKLLSRQFGMNDN